MPDNRFSAQAALATLKDFQRDTVDYVFERLFGENNTTRFLVADEVGLGKTLIARGVIARTLEHLQDKKDRVDIIYICSSAAIAGQNQKRLNLSGSEGFSLSTRLTYLPRQVSELRNNKVNFISLTSGTTFDHTVSREGHAGERATLYRILYDLPLGQGERRTRLRTGLLNLLQARMGKASWRATAQGLRADELDNDLCRMFRREVLDDKPLYAQLKQGCEQFIRYRDSSRIPPDDTQLRLRLIMALRQKLAFVCLKALKSDLVILDEFQRFKHLLDAEDDTARLATALFEQKEARVLLLSATPYKMFTLDNETGEDDHYPDFIRTLSFLMRDPAQVNHVSALLSAHRAALHAGMPEGEKARLQDALLRVMCRTERISDTRDRNAMLVEVPRIAPLQATDIRHIRAVDAVAACVDAGDLVEYWKSTPHLLNFLKRYALRNKLDAAIDAPSPALSAALRAARDEWLTPGQLDDYQPLEPGNARMRLLFEDTIDNGLWQLLWMPPSLPYYTPGGVWQGKSHLTKTLIFSCWNAVPDAIATLCSYEAERRMVSGESVTHRELYQKIKPLLRFAKASADDRLTGMPVMAWLMPSPVLATAIDPLTMACAGDNGPLPLETVLEAARDICETLVAALPSSPAEGKADPRWYWAAPVLLDAQGGLLAWCKDPQGWRALVTPDADDDSHFTAHLEQLTDAAEGRLTLGPKPDDLADVLALFALGGPGTCALRALQRLDPQTGCDSMALLTGAATIASGFRTLFNMPETIAMLRGASEETYWRLTLKYGVEGNLQSMLDEYVHTLRESPGVQGSGVAAQVATLSAHIQSVLSLRVSRLHLDALEANDAGFERVEFSTRCRFALRFGDIRDDNNDALVRAEIVRDAFNSPFRPFVLASTSIGQEGLDFHTWCHAVMHWNLPANPVDLEQREGRVHRYKGHAVRKNIAHAYGIASLKGHNAGDPWQTLFARAAQDRAPGQSELIPYWIFEDGPARVERRIPVLPYSRETGKLKRLKQGLALYRLAFGQPRQEDLLSSLSHNAPISEDALAGGLISLKPPGRSGKA
ncbi:DEAD/DEAH box helicase [Cronobacter sp. HA18006]|uniref:helicase-related protein n=1 Tax=Cronobacter TaxID=413496 RepID=UPI000CFB33D3|nr:MULTISPECIES: helicase-related protein [Cronobacter]EJJ0549397.1 helicase [Cronobacter sakazakii]ELY6084163.1 helicase [Cronobacter sakazakii]MDT3574342.1 helicase-related protein [Cronobacter sakazakii]NCH20486.1 helicase [Cronobacter sakazakii]NHW94673.1 DEAD/DEAH box helicase [Cronobacter sp. HA18006]